MRNTGRSQVPDEINDHLRIYSKNPWEVEYRDECTVCRSRIDEFGLCACGTMGGD